MSNLNENNIYALYEENSDVRDAAITLRTNLEFTGIDQEVRSVAVTSAEMSVGKSTISIALAMAMAESGKRTLIIDNDFRNPQVQLRLKLRGGNSLTDVLSGRVPLETACIPTRLSNLYVLDLGSRRINNSVDVLRSERYKRLIEQLKQWFDFIVVDTPPIGMFIDAALSAQLTDGAVFVVNAGKTNAKEVKEALAQLEKANVRVLGAVLNNVVRSHSNYYYYDRRGQRKKRGTAQKK